jgi:hypothetical protein
MIVDSVLVSVYTSIPKEPDPSINLLIFTAFVAFFIFSNYIFLRYPKNVSSNTLKSKLGIREPTRKLIIASQIALSSILIMLIAEILTLGSYDLVLIMCAIYISHVIAIGLLILLAHQFVRWFLANKNYLIVAYAFAFSIIIPYLMTSLAFLTFDLSYRDPEIKMKSIKTTMSDYSTYGTKLYSLTLLYTYLSIISLVSIWVPSVILLRTYSGRVGKIRYWTLVSIPLIYFFFPYFGNEVGIFDILILEYGMEFNLIYYIIFSPYKQIGGLLFGIVFWVIASKIKRYNLKIPLRIAGIGMILLFGSAVLHGLTFIVSPPFGLVTISYMGLASYMLLIGIFSSARELSRDLSVRREIYKITGEQLGLLSNIGVAELNKTLEKRVNKIFNTMKDEIDVPTMEPELEESDYKRFIEDALAEVGKANINRKKPNG